MANALRVFGVGAILVGAFMALSPEQFFAVVDWDSRSGQYAAATIRVVTGLFFILGASASRYPTGFRIFGGLVLLIGIGFFLIPLDLWLALIRWVAAEHLAAKIRVGGIGAVLLGAFIIHAVWPEPSGDQPADTSP